MAVPFYLPDQDENGSGNTSNSSHSPNMITSATQTPLQSPVSGEHLIQAFCEAFYRCSANGSIGFQYSPPSPSCSMNSPFSPQGEQVFFPRGRSTPRSPRVSVTEDGTVFRYTRSQRNSIGIQRRSRLTSTGDDDMECHSEHETSWDEHDDHYVNNYMAARDRLQEFPGRIPPRKKKKDVHKSKPKSREQSLTWPTVVSVFVFAVGCGFFVIR